MSVTDPMPDDPTDPKADPHPFRYTGVLAGQIENRWQAYWDDHATFHTPNPVGSLAASPDHESVGEPTADKPKYFVLDMFAGPSGRCTSATGWATSPPTCMDATCGCAATTCCMRSGSTRSVCPPSSTRSRPASILASRPSRPSPSSVGNCTGSGWGMTTARGVSTTDVSFYRWTQWIFLQIFNSWYDDEQDRARPVAELVAEFENGTRPTPDGRPWADLGEAERSDGGRRAPAGLPATRRS